MQKEIKVLNGQTIFDVALICYNDASLVYDLIAENSVITDITMDLTNLTLLYTPKNVFKLEAKENVKKVNKVVTITPEQSLFDLTLQYYGNVENIYDLIKNNDFIDNILSNNYNGNVLNINYDGNYITDFFAKSLNNIGTKPKTITEQETSFLLQENGYYLLQEDGFKIIL